jgi:hypothetical protein
MTIVNRLLYTAMVVQKKERYCLSYLRVDGSPAISNASAVVMALASRKAEGRATHTALCKAV